MPDLSRDDARKLGELFRRRRQLERQIADPAAEIKSINKQIDTLSKQAGDYFPKGKTERTRFGLRFRLIRKNGRVAWRTIVEKLRSKEYAAKLAADAKPSTVCVLDPETIPGDDV